jgi:hypothetical protein
VYPSQYEKYEKEDVIYIAEHGARFPLEIAKQLIASEDL